MEDKKLKFYELGDESNFEVLSYDKNIEISNIAENKKNDEKYTKTVNLGLKSIIKKDIENLSSKVVIINNKVIKTLALNEIMLEEKLDSKIENIENIINSMEVIISNVIIEKSKIKIHIFSSNKKEKKEKIASLNSCISFLTRCESDYIALKDEYNKLLKRLNSIENIEEEKNKSNEDALERTINFYINKEES